MKVISPMAPSKFPKMPEVKGVRLAAISSGIKEANCLDLFIAELDIGCTIGGVLTQSLLPSASRVAVSLSLLLLSWLLDINDIIVYSC